MCPCHFSYCQTKGITSPGPEKILRRIACARNTVIYCKVPWTVDLKKRMTGKGSKGTNGTGMGTKAPAAPNDGQDHLVPGEWVEVLSLEEIESMLDYRHRMKGLNFMPEMKKYAGKKFRVFKRVERIMLEATGELRFIKRPTYYLEGVYCDGEFHNQCDRSCFLLWREEWLRRTTPP